MSIVGTISTTIANGASLSSAADIGDCGVCGFELSGWTSAIISFAVCRTSTGTFLPLIDPATGAEYQIPTPSGVASGVVAVPIKEPSLFLGWRYVKVRSGVVGTPTNQDAARTVTVLARPFA